MAIDQPSSLPAKSTEKLGEPGQLDAIMLLTRDHWAMQQELTDFERSTDLAHRARLLRHVISELKKHERAEQQVFWPAIRAKLPNGQQVASARLLEEELAARTMAGLESLQAAAADWVPSAQSLIAEVLTHVSREEREVFGPARELLPVEWLMDLGREIERARG